MLRRLAVLAVVFAVAPLFVPRASAASTPYSGTPITLPGHIKAEDFDNGGEGVAYHDTTPGNSGGMFRQTGVDIETCAEGGYDIGWTAAGEWLNYTVSAAAGSYTVELRVASMSGGTMHVGFNGPSDGVWKSVSIPATGGWQAWKTVSVPVTLGGGTQQLTILFDNGGVNLDYIDIASASSSTTTSTSSSTSTSTSGGGTITVVNWNTKVNSTSSHAIAVIDQVMKMTPQPQVVVLQEVRQSLFNTYISELEARSGKSWDGVLRTHCPPGAWTGSYCSSSEDEGTAVFTSLPILEKGSTFLPGADQYHSARGLARVAVNVGGIKTQVMSVHLALDASVRTTEISALKAYASRLSVPQIVGGDFNAGTSEARSKMSPDFVDSWTQVGSGNGYTAFSPTPSMKIDFLFEDDGGRAKPAWSVVVTAAGTTSDHYPIINSFSVR